MRLLLVVVLVLHGLIHLLGVAKAFGLAALPQLTQPIAAGRGWLWLAAALLFVAAAIGVVVMPRWWWAAGAAALVVSTIAIAGSWHDAKAGAVVNLGLLAVVIIAAAIDGPWGLRAEYDRDVRQALARPRLSPVVTEDDLAPLPAPVQRYLRVVGVVGRPRVWNMRARMRGRIRAGVDQRWMPLRAEQHNVFDDPGRFFYMTATMFGVPADGYHRFAGGAATMRVKAAGLVPVQQSSGAEMTQAETVTLFNDMCVLAPATLLDPAIAWEPVDDQRVRAAFTHAGHAIRAELEFNAAGELVNFWSDDRRQTSGDGRTLTNVRWSTPIDGYRDFGGARLMRRGQARWHEAAGDYAYIELELEDVRYNVP
jgi:hypothetical protein